MQLEGVQGLKTELMNVNRIMEGTEDDIRDEITMAGGFATESQVQAMKGARNKTLIKQANQLTQQLALKEDYINQIMKFSEMDREQVEKMVDRKLGLAETLVNLQMKMDDSARDNYQNIIENIGYSGLIQSLGGDAQKISSVARSLGMTSSQFSRLAYTQTAKQKQVELDVAKFEEDKRKFGLEYALKQKEVALKQREIAQKTPQGMTPYQAERQTRILNDVDSLKDKIVDENGNVNAYANTVLGVGSYTRFIRGTPAFDFAAQVDSLKANIFTGELTAMREASKTGGAVGNVSDKEGDRLAAVLGALDTGQSPEQFAENLQKIKDSIDRWNIAMNTLGGDNSIETLASKKGFDLEAARNSGWKDSEILNYLNK